MTVIVENLHAVSHFCSGTFSLLRYTRDFGRIVKEDIKRKTKWSTNYFTHKNSYYPIQQNSNTMNFSEAKFMRRLPSKTISKALEEKLKEWAAAYRPVRQKTVRDKTKDEAGMLPHQVYVDASRQNDTETAVDLENEDNGVVNQQDTAHDNGDVEIVENVAEEQPITNGNGDVEFDVTVVNELPIPDGNGDEVQLMEAVDDEGLNGDVNGDIEVVEDEAEEREDEDESSVRDEIEQLSEYDTDSEDDEIGVAGVGNCDEFSIEDYPSTHIPVMSRSGRMIRARTVMNL